MKYYVWGAWAALAIVAGLLQAAAQAQALPEAIEQVETDAPNYSVQVRRTGQLLRVSIETESREQSRLLFGERFEHQPTIEIFKDDLLLTSGSFAFG